MVAVAWLEQLSMECWNRKLGRLRKETELPVLAGVSDMTCIVSSLSSSLSLSLSLLPGRLPKLTEG